MSLAEKRKALNLSQHQIAKLIGVSINTYLNWEYGTMMPNEENLKKLNAVLGVK